MLHAVHRLFIASLLLASCAQAPTESRLASDVILADRLDAFKVVTNRTAARALITQRVADAQSRVSGSAAALLASTDGIELFSFIVSCAIPQGVILTATTAHGDLDFFGEVGLAPQWLTGPLDLAGQRWLSACLFARVNAHSVAIPFSARGPHFGLTADADERAFATLEEGAFYGNLFVPDAQPIQWFACRGRDEAAREDGDLADRDCAEPDPAKPTVTQCGFAFAGDCGSFSASQACESFSTGGTFYRRCHTAPIQSGPSEVFEQVITTFVAP